MYSNLLKAACIGCTGDPTGHYGWQAKPIKYRMEPLLISRSQCFSTNVFLTSLALGHSLGNFVKRKDIDPGIAAKF